MAIFFVLLVLGIVGVFHSRHARTVEDARFDPRPAEFPEPEVLVAPSTVSSSVKVDIAPTVERGMRIDVRSAIDGSPVAGAKIRFWSKEHGAGWFGETSEDGTGLAPHASIGFLSVTKAGFARYASELADATEHLEIRLGRGATLSGRVKIRSSERIPSPGTSVTE